MGIRLHEQRTAVFGFPATADIEWISSDGRKCQWGTLPRGAQCRWLISIRYLDDLEGRPQQEPIGEAIRETSLRVATRATAGQPDEEFETHTLSQRPQTAKAELRRP
jgi:hypothetical protein